MNRIVSYLLTSSLALISLSFFLFSTDSFSFSRGNSWFLSKPNTSVPETDYIYSDQVNLLLDREIAKDFKINIIKDLFPYLDKRISSRRCLEYCDKFEGAFCLSLIQGKLYTNCVSPGYQSRHKSSLSLIYSTYQRFFDEFSNMPDIPEMIFDVTDGDLIGRNIGDSSFAPRQNVNNTEIYRKVEEIFHSTNKSIIHHDDSNEYTPGLVITEPVNHRKFILYPDFTFYSWFESECPEGNLQHNFFRSHAYSSLYDQFNKSQTSKKKSSLFWRGGRIHNPDRTTAVEQFEKHGNGLNGIEFNVHFTDWKGENNCVDIVDHCQYEYLAFLPGNTYSSRFKYCLFCGSTVFAQTPEFTEWWFPFLTPNTDYVELPSWKDEGLVPKLLSNFSNTEEMKNIANSGRKLVQRILHPNNIQYYFLFLFQAYSKLHYVQGNGEFNMKEFKPIEDVIVHNDRFKWVGKDHI